MFLVFGIYFVFKAITAKNWKGVSNHRRRLNAFGEDAGRLDCIILPALMFIGLLVTHFA